MASLLTPAPDTPACRAALEVATEYYPESLFHHCLRSWHLARALARRLGLEVDEELLYVAAVLHDLGLTREFDGHWLPFEDAGGHVGAALTAGAGWPARRRQRVREVVVRHMWDTVDPAEDPEGHVLEAATSLDIGGLGADTWPPEDLRAVLERHPRLDLAERFVRCFEDQERRKPSSAAGRAVRSGIAERLRTNPLAGLDPHRS